MNKHLRELLTAIQNKTNEAKSYMEGENKDIEKATALMDEVDALQTEFDAEKRVFEAEKMQAGQALSPITDPAEKAKETETVGIAKAIRDGLLNKAAMSEGVGADGGYTVPEDIVTKVEHYKDVDYDLGQDIEVVAVSTNKGARTFQKKGQTEAFEDVEELAAIGKEIAAPQFERLSYVIKDRAGFMPLSNNLSEDSDENIENVVVEWLGKANAATNNAQVLALVAEKAQTTFKTLDDIKKALNVTLGQAYKAGAKIYTNDDGLQYLDTLKDNNGRDLLKVDPSDPLKKTIAIGVNVVELKVIPNTVLASTGNKVPFIVGNLFDYVRKYDRKALSIMSSNVATIGSFNAFAMNMTLFRAIIRNDFTIKDADSIVNGVIDTTKADI